METESNKNFWIILVFFLATFSSFYVMTEEPTVDCLKNGKYEEAIRFTEAQVIEPVLPNFPSSPIRNPITKGCVGLSFTISEDGFAEDILVKEVSHGRMFSRSAVKALKKYKFKAQKEKVFNAYLVIHFN